MELNGTERPCPDVCGLHVVVIVGAVVDCAELKPLFHSGGIAENWIGFGGYEHAFYSEFFLLTEYQAPTAQHVT